jgi:UDP-N-acetyl-2-amino-2-deoxyglucuronate dehydrogenase
MSTLRYALIGCAGQIAATHIQAIAQLPDVTFVGMADVALERGRARADEAGCPFFADYGELLAETRPDVVVVCTPHPLHAPIVIAALRAGAHVLVEKPIAVEVAEADMMIDAAASTGRLLGVSFQHRFDPAVEAMRGFIERGDLGALIRVECVEPWFRTDAYYRSAGWRSTWRGEGGGVLLNQAIHTLDVLCYVIGLPEVVVGRTKVASHAVECEDTAVAMLAYVEGAVGTLSVSTIEAGTPRRLQLVGDRASLLLSGDELSLAQFTPTLSSYQHESSELFGEPAVSTRRLDVGSSPAFGQGHIRVHRDFYEAVVSGGTVRCTGASGRMSLELANAITLSSCTRQPVHLPLHRQTYSFLLADLRAGKQRLPGAVANEVS